MAALSESHLRTIYNANEGIDGIHSLIVCNAIVIFRVSAGFGYFLAKRMRLTARISAARARS